MKKIVLAIVVAVMVVMLVVPVAMAQTGHIFELRPLDASGPPYVAQNWALIHNPGNPGGTFVTSSHTWYINYGGAATSAAPVTYNMLPGMGMNMSMDDPANSRVAISALYFMPYPTMPGSYIVATWTLNNPGTMMWDQVDPNFLIDINGTTYSQVQLSGWGELDPLLGVEEPAPPIAEILTIVLISMGLIALGGYVWYRRHRAKAALVAA